jgi:UDP-glucose 4-epimerase
MNALEENENRMVAKKSMNILITGGAGFIGSALVAFLLSKNYRVTVADHLPTADSSGRLERFSSFKNFKFIGIDLLDSKKLTDIVKGCDIVFHLAANVDVRKGHLNTELDFLNNIVATRNLLESMRTSDTCKKIVFTSSSVVYGEPTVIPTPETYGPLKPISIYGASKLACEALVSGYVGTFGIEAVIFRLANVVGPSSGHGVIFDFLDKLRRSEGELLEILGDGNQNKSYLYIDDCINALILGLNQFDSGLEIFNLGSDDQVDTNTIAKIIIDELGLSPKIKYLSESKDGRGWIGDVKNMLLSTDKLKTFGWRIRHTSQDSVLLTVKSIMDYEQIKRQ